MLTTITPYWGRPDMLRLWLANLKKATTPEVFHLVYFIGEPPPEWWDEEAAGMSIRAVLRYEPSGSSIGYYHNLGALVAATEWMMKLDVDAFPNEHYFKELLPVLLTAGPNEWFNGGMFYMSKFYSLCMLSHPLIGETYRQIMANRRTYSAIPFLTPAASNFICRRREYLFLGGSAPGFKGYGWEDYQQLYMLEKHALGGKDPLPGPVTLENVTRRCRDEISRPKAKALWERNPWLCLLHHWHPAAKGSDMSHNRRILYEYIKASKGPQYEPIAR